MILFRILLSTLLLPLVFMMGTTSQAQAEPRGCNGRAQTLMSSRTQKEYFIVPVTQDRINYYVTGNLGYWYCPNADNPWKTKSVWAEACWLQTGPEYNHRLFDGVTINFRVKTNRGMVTNPPSFKIPDDDTRQNCERQLFDDDITEWSLGVNKPRWAASFTLNLTALNDHNHDFGEGSDKGGLWKAFKPRQDTIIKQWWRLYDLY